MKKIFWLIYPIIIIAGKIIRDWGYIDIILVAAVYVVGNMVGYFMGKEDREDKH